MTYKSAGPPGAFGSAMAAELRAHLETHHLSQAELSRRTGISANYLNKRFNQELPFTTNDLEKIAAALNLSIPALVADAEQRRRQREHQQKLEDDRE